jgi:NADPH-dependent curcumin reductase CurA
LVRNIWMSVDPHMKIFMESGTEVRAAFQLNKTLTGGCVRQAIESRSDKFNVGEYVLEILVGESIGFQMIVIAVTTIILQKLILKSLQYSISWEYLA